ncbi:zinc finger protein 384-like isoform X2 [Varroa jacobsoni]|uniref:zinc finger protein 384-like isoform X2 n=1 Tax=Varroa jacobsoni TaxID=62625 RepID=UPI000BF5B3E3|nr:zinc finger protein 384-like isoform X2 [Varroa jacobsoni]XP_022700048.1 zinc finger protein 384-like isoform X2 [Varroa jacobsoni]
MFVFFGLGATSVDVVTHKVPRNSGCSSEEAASQGLLAPFFFHCNVCPLRFNSIQFLKRHKAKVHGEAQVPYKCPRCVFSCHDYAYFRRHITVHSDIKPFGCTYCGYASAYKHNLKTHIKNMHGEYLIKCPHCFEKFITRDEVDKHVRYHHFISKS